MSPTSERDCLLPLEYHEYALDSISHKFRLDSL